MAERYRTDNIQRWTRRGLLLFILPLPLIPTLLVTLLRGSLSLALAALLAILLCISGAVLNRRGLALEREYHRRKVASAPRIPRKLLGSLLTGAGVVTTSYFLIGQGPFFSLFAGLLAVTGFYLTYGFDPIADKGVAETGFGYTTGEVFDAIRGAEQKIAGIRKAAGGLKNLELRQRLSRIADSAQQIVGVIEENPEDLRRARKFLNVYLDGARKVAEGYARTHQRTQSEALEANFRNVLITIEDVFTEQHAKLLENDVMDLDVQIEVLATRLKNEGVS